MIKANELRIGNIIEWNKSIFNVCKISEDSIENELWCKPLTEIHPIPLTEQWLLKFGFKKDGHYNSAKRFMGIFNQPIIETNGYYTIPNYPLTELKYVHQLQNLYFALTGQELELK